MGKWGKSEYTSIPRSGTEPLLDIPIDTPYWYIENPVQPPPPKCTWETFRLPEYTRAGYTLRTGSAPQCTEASIALIEASRASMEKPIKAQSERAALKAASSSRTSLRNEEGYEGRYGP